MQRFTVPTFGIEKIKELNPKGIIFTGGPQSVYKEESQHIGKEIFELGIPIFGFCYGAQLIAYELGGGGGYRPCQRIWKDGNPCGEVLRAFLRCFGGDHRFHVPHRLYCQGAGGL